ncbi:hypothetical protein F4604DRAFT_1683717 [Suillus subluteus]|nr:hypothetical protein F4604DRAFT_1683717 [Suillus subluteus]
MRFILAVIAALASSIFARPTDEKAPKCPTFCSTEEDCKDCYSMPCNFVTNICTKAVGTDANIGGSGSLTMRFVLAVIAALASSIFAIPTDKTGVTWCPDGCNTDADCQYCYGTPCFQFSGVCGYYSFGYDEEGPGSCDPLHIYWLGYFASVFALSHLFSIPSNSHLLVMQRSRWVE